MIPDGLRTTKPEPGGLSARLFLWKNAPAAHFVGSTVPMGALQEKSLRSTMRIVRDAVYAPKSAPQKPLSWKER